MEPFLGQITLFACNFAPYNWALCQGQILSISQYSALFALLGTQYGGNGTSTFALPDLRGRVPVGQGQAPGLSAYVMGEMNGAENVTLTTSTVPPHTHALPAHAAPGTTKNPAGASLAQGPGSSGKSGTSAMNLYHSGNPNTPLSPRQVSPAGSGLPHNNLQPTLALNWCIALSGVFPSRG